MTDAGEMAADLSAVAWVEQGKAPDNVTAKVGGTGAIWSTPSGPPIVLPPCLIARHPKAARVAEAGAVDAGIAQNHYWV